MKTIIFAYTFLALSIALFVLYFGSLIRLADIQKLEHDRVKAELTTLCGRGLKEFEINGEEVIAICN